MSTTLPEQGHSFTCPDCGGHYFGTDGTDPDNWIVHCHTMHCGWTGSHREYVDSTPPPEAALAISPAPAALAGLIEAAELRVGEGHDTQCDYEASNGKLPCSCYDDALSDALAAVKAQQPAPTPCPDCTRADELIATAIDLMTTDQIGQWSGVRAFQEREVAQQVERVCGGCRFWRHSGILPTAEGECNKLPEAIDIPNADWAFTRCDFGCSEWKAKAAAPDSERDGEGESDG